MEAVLNAVSSVVAGQPAKYNSIKFALVEDPTAILSNAQCNAIKADFLSRLPDLPRGTQLSICDMFSEELWDSLDADQRRAVATQILYMTVNVVHLMPIGRGLDTTYSIHDPLSPTAEMAKEAFNKWLDDDELHRATAIRQLKKYLDIRSKGVCSPELDYLIETTQMEVARCCK